MGHSGNTNSYEFSNDTDIILRSSDNVDFYVIGALLRHVSLVFKNMFASSRSDNDEKKDHLPVVPVAEDSETLRLLLDIIYPYEEEPQLSSPVVVRKVSKATQKYMMDLIERKLKRLTANSKLITELPLSVYAIAIDLGWGDPEVVTNAARRTLKTPLQKLAYVDELDIITGADFYRFLEYRRLCEKLKDPQEVVLPPIRCHRDSIEARTSSSSGSDTYPSNHIEGTPASVPYTHSDLSDLIIRTPDGVDFYVVAAFLRLSSPFFNRKFPLENPVTKDGLAVIDVQEDSNVLYCLLGFVYPLQEPEIQGPGLYAQLVFAARKYEMVHIEDRVKKHATASSLVAADPLRIYAVASTLGWTGLAKKAALNTLNTPVQELSYVDEMHLMTGTQLFRLMRFRFACANAACNVLETNTFKKFGLQGSVLQSILDNNRTRVDADPSERLKACPRGSTLANAYDQGVSKYIAELTRDRSDSASGGFLLIFKILRCMQDAPKEVEEAISKVDLLSCLYE